MVVVLTFHMIYTNKYLVGIRYNPEVDNYWLLTEETWNGESSNLSSIEIYQILVIFFQMFLCLLSWKSTFSTILVLNIIS